MREGEREEKNQTRIINILLELEREIKKLLQANNLSPISRVTTS